jgi:hypothetical protein
MMRRLPLGSRQATLHNINDIRCRRKNLRHASIAVDHSLTVENAIARDASVVFRQPIFGLV